MVRGFCRWTRRLGWCYSWNRRRVWKRTSRRIQRSWRRDGVVHRWLGGWHTFHSKKRGWCAWGKGSWRGWRTRRAWNRAKWAIKGKNRARIGWERACREGQWVRRGGWWTRVGGWWTWVGGWWARRKRRWAWGKRRWARRKGRSTRRKG